MTRKTSHSLDLGSYWWTTRSEPHLPNAQLRIHGFSEDEEYALVTFRNSGVPQWKEISELKQLWLTPISEPAPTH